MRAAWLTRGPAADLEKARAAYEAAREADPHALDSVDEHSNVLFVLGDRAALAELAHNAVHSDKYSPRVCYAIGTCSRVGCGYEALTPVRRGRSWRRQGTTTASAASTSGRWCTSSGRCG